jgi:hypothetical protein
MAGRHVNFTLYMRLVLYWRVPGTTTLPLQRRHTI